MTTPRVTLTRFHGVFGPDRQAHAAGAPGGDEPRAQRLKRVFGIESRAAYLEKVERTMAGL